MRIAAVVGLILTWGCGSEWIYEDLDGDGFTSAQGDCWDRIEGPEGSGLSGDQIHPDAVEIWYDGFDSNCANDDDFDSDYDLRVPDEFVGRLTYGVTSSGELMGGDCWDAPISAELPDEYTVVPSSIGIDPETGAAWIQPLASEVHPSAVEIWYDGVDSNCDGLDDFDQDLDTYRTSMHPDRDGELGTDCIDGSVLDWENLAEVEPADVHIDAEEIYYDGTDQDCSTETDDCDQDGDGALFDGLDTTFCLDDNQDCDDEDPTQTPTGEPETFYNGQDDNCNVSPGDEDGDKDGDGFWAADYLERVSSGGYEINDDLSVPASLDDCWDDDDLDAESIGMLPFAAFDAWVAAQVNPDMVDRPYDSVDQDCAGGDDWDWDGDGDRSQFYVYVEGSPLAVGGDCVDCPTDCSTAEGDFLLYCTELCGVEDANPAGLNPMDVNSDVFFDEPYDGTDADCDDWSDYDADRDGEDAEFFGGTDCIDGGEYDDDNPAFLDPDAVNTAATETWYDGTDQDCNDLSDYDADEDGFDTEAFGGTDCIDDGIYDDANPGGIDPDAVNTAATETWYDGTDQDCNDLSDYDADEDGFDTEAFGGTDCIDDGVYDDDNPAGLAPEDVNIAASDDWYDGTDADCDDNDGDADGDGYYLASYAYPIPAAYESGDCDDAEATVFPTASEVCDGQYNDCNDTEWSASIAPDDETDDDGDGYVECSVDAGGWDGSAITDGEDCDDGDSTVYPSASELCDGQLNDCDGSMLSTEADDDGDGYVECTLQGAWDGPGSKSGEDCDDDDSTVYPSASELCDGQLNDCDGSMLSTEADDDGDGYVECSVDSGGWDGSAITDGDDCDDTFDGTYPGAVEECDGQDNDCDDTTDEGLLGLGEECAAFDCLDIYDNVSGASDGLWWIEPDGEPFEALCDMSSDGGGWTLILAADGASDYWGNNSAYWALEGTDIAPSTLDGSDFHGQAYGDLITEEIRLCYSDMTQCHTFEHNLGFSLLAFFTDDESYVQYSQDSLGYSDAGSSSDMNDYLVNLGVSINSYGCYWLGINYTPAFSGIGLMGDSNQGCVGASGTTYPYHDDLAIGLGLNSCHDENSCFNGGSGHAAGQTRGWDGVDDSGVYGPWYVWGR